jgi:uncharacterized YccA/Bax inhibitor family protein
MEGFGEFINAIFTYLIGVAVIFTVGFFIGKYVGYQDGITKCNNETIMEQLQK